MNPIQEMLMNAKSNDEINAIVWSFNEEIHEARLWLSVRAARRRVWQLRRLMNQSWTLIDKN